MTFWKFILSTILCFAIPCAAAEPASVTPEQEPRLPLWSIVADIPDTAWHGMKLAFSREALPGWGVVIGSTAVLYHYDEDILNDVQHKGQSWGLGNNVNYESWINVGNLTLFSGPKDTAGWLYFMGDGVIPIVTSVGLLGTGFIASNSHAYNTGIEISDALLTAAIFDQLIKHTAGRESPSERTENRGKWQAISEFEGLRR